MQTLDRFTRLEIEGTLREFGIEDKALAEKLTEVAYRVRAFQVSPAAPRPTWEHPAVQMVKRIMGQRVDAIMIPDVIRAVADKPEKQVAECYREWCKRYRSGTYGWLDWLEHGIPDRQKPNGRPSERARGLGQEIVYERSQAEFPAHLVTD